MVIMHHVSVKYTVIIYHIDVYIVIIHHIDVIHKYVRDLYAKRFPELEKIVVTPLEFVATVQVCTIALLFYNDENVGYFSNTCNNV